ncbi:hypothetical protein [Anianabacter salinae]|uniref:hypothetical protein n=1 Tax=Anianabacter salinae TaxID=2851023 RepID=UPI00225E6D9A|nr:hypothetical protein [Anianabacter salinae]MBV0911497.1 hypothetical protein [Anianabacter salinae]
MKIAFHLGAHCTDDDKLARSLLKNDARLREYGVVCVRPRRFRTIIRDTTLELRGTVADAETQERVIDAMLGDEHAERMILSFQNFICGPGRVFDDGDLYAKGGFKARWLADIFPDHQPEFFIAIRNPATFVPALFDTLPRGTTYDALMQGVDPLDIRWSPVIARIMQENPGAPVTVWCNEDTPFVWPEILREISDLDASVPLEGNFDIIETIMSPEGYERMQSYLATRPPANEAQRRRVLSAFLDKFALDDELEDEIDLPGWTPELLDELTDVYDEDFEQIARMPGVNVIAA